MKSLSFDIRLNLENAYAKTHERNKRQTIQI